MSHVLTRRRLVVTAATSGIVLAGAAPRGLLAQSGTPESSPAASPSAVTDAFPVTIPHVFGETVIPAPPARVIALGWSTPDAVIALGVDPVAIPFQEWGGDAEGFLPWTRAALEGRPLPVTLDTLAEIPFEDIIGLEPDVILAPFSGITAEEYDTLSRIAPTVAYPEVAWGTSWQDVQLITGRALGLSAAAEQLVADTETLIASQSEIHPQLAGKTFAYGNVGQNTTFNFYTTTDIRSLFLTAIGLEPSEFTRSLDAQADEFTYYVEVSFELAQTIEADIVVMWFGSEEEYAAAQELPAFQAIPAVSEGRFAAIVGQDLVMATSAFSVLSIPYMIERFIPTLAEAADNVG